MPLTPVKVARQHIHARQITCNGYLRDDGDWDIEGCLTDKKSYSFPNIDRGQVAAGEPVHEMYIRITVTTQLLIKDIEATTDNGPFQICNNITASFHKLIGTQIKPGFQKELYRHLGGTKGCTHHTDLLKSMATTAIQTIFPYLARQEALTKRDDKKSRPNMHQLNQCHAYATDGELVRTRWPELYNGKDETDKK